MTKLIKGKPILYGFTAKHQQLPLLPPTCLGTNAEAGGGTRPSWWNVLRPNV